LLPTAAFTAPTAEERTLPAGDLEGDEVAVGLREEDEEGGGSKGGVCAVAGGELERLPLGTGDGCTGCTPPGGGLLDALLLITRIGAVFVDAG